MSIENPQMTLKEMFRNDISKWIHAVETYFETHTTFHMILNVFLVLLAIIGAIVDLAEFSRNFWPPFATRILLIIIIIFLTTINIRQVILRKKKAQVIIRQLSMIDSLTKIIRDASGLNAPPYRILDWYVEHDISVDGDVTYKRVMEIEHINETVYWVKVPITVIDGNTEDKADDLNIRVVNPIDGGQLPYVIIRDRDDEKILAILLEPPVLPGQNSKIRLQLTWRGAYLPLIRNYKDHGKITVVNETAKITVRFFAPKGIMFTGIRMHRNLGTSCISTIQDGRSMLEWSHINIPKGEYPYTLICQKSEP